MAEGLSLLDEAMLPVVAGELSPWVTGLIYCSVIEGCQQVLAVDRAREWTAALARWCEEQPEMVSFTGKCLVHRAEIMRLARHLGRSPGGGETLLRTFRERHRSAAPGRGLVSAGGDTPAAGRLRSRRGCLPYREPLGRGTAAWTGAAQDDAGAKRDRGSRDPAGGRCDDRPVSPGERCCRPMSRSCWMPAMSRMRAPPARQLEQIAERYDTGLLGAIAAHARGAVELAEGDAQAALSLLRRALQLWQDVDAPHEVARARFLAGLACRALGDEEGAELELDAARAVFEQLQAAPDLARLERRAKDDDASGRLTG